ncbi:MAG: tryptophan synthase subunit alpha [Micavibrio sp.]|nr:tryptophan synthase subunit alpha [Micavibrio sp.]
MTLRATLLAARAAGTSAFIPFIMAGDPDMAASEDVILGLEAAGAAALELGVPFSDPVADGITVQRAAERALAKGATLQGVFALVKRLRARGLKMPVCLFSYLNPVYKMGYTAFIKAAQEAGVQGALLVDLPPEEAGEYVTAAKAAQFETVFLCSPTTSKERLTLVDQSSSGFVYYVSREGVTGAQAALPQQLNARLAELKDTLQNPVAVGFGISTPQHVQALRGKADGIVVGSALVKIIEENQAAAANATAACVKKLLA